MQLNYQNESLRQLRDQLVRFAPQDKKAEQANRAESLLREIEPDKDYPYEYLYYRITDFRPDSDSDTAAHSATIPGKEASHDLRLFVENLTDSADIPVEAAGEEVLTVDQLSKKFSVSTKTISRWRQQGLVSRRFLFEGRKRVGFLKSSVDRFVETHPQKIERGRQFSQLKGTEKDEIIDRARRLAHAGGCPSEVTRRIAGRMQRSIETIRYTLKNYDEKHPETAIFPRVSGPLSDSAKSIIYREYLSGVSVDRLADKHCRTRNTIYRLINEERSRQISELPLEFVFHESFENKRNEAEILGPLPD
ncbi:MAG: helix-turn-helix transcriptional regulator, partial [Pirellulales bacterium]